MTLPRPARPRRTARAARRLLTAALAASALTTALAACGEPGSAGGGSPSAGGTGGTTAAAATCEPVPDEALVVLEDDKNLQTVDNVVPAVNAAAAEADPELLPLLDTVSAALDTDILIELNRAVDVDRRSSEEVAIEFVETAGLAAADTTAGQGKRVAVGAADFAESATLGTIYATVLQTAGYDATVTTIGNREIGRAHV